MQRGYLQTFSVFVLTKFVTFFCSAQPSYSKKIKNRIFLDMSLQYILSQKRARPSFGIKIQLLILRKSFKTNV